MVHVVLTILIVENHRAEIAYDLGTRFWKRGYATEAVRALMEWGKESFELHRIEAKVDPRNSASIALLEKLGFSEEGLLRDYEKLVRHTKMCNCFRG